MWLMQCFRYFTLAMTVYIFPILVLIVSSSTQDVNFMIINNHFTFLKFISFIIIVCALYVCVCQIPILLVVEYKEHKILITL